MSEKILFDTDIGSDIDDAVALAYLLAQPQCQLLGITTVSGEADKRAAMADAMVRCAGKSVPVFAGASGPIAGENRQPKAQQAEALTRWPHAEFSSNALAALSFMRDTIRQNPGEVTLLAVGPMTNIGLLFAADPELPALLKRLVLMCGEFERVSGVGRGEWNAVNDVSATTRVYEARPPVHRSLGLNVTNQVVMSADEVKRRFAQHALLQPVLDFAEVWFRHAQHITFHDPLAAVSIFDESICQWRNMSAVVEPTGRAAGTTWATFDDEGPHQVAVAVDAQRFFARYFEVFA